MLLTSRLKWLLAAKNSMLGSKFRGTYGLVVDEDAVRFLVVQLQLVHLGIGRVVQCRVGHSVVDL